ncbi:MAG TPA: peptide ABC transporter substrate-binding protein [Spirochaetia bacterium]|nr:peptide ABC transporter substrate-binding protein [Spirochaetales bacterium]HRY80242.1 peptide ABC transporter substrate-binding protein [Spirochaetia bacterium]
MKSRAMIIAVLMALAATAGAWAAGVDRYYAVYASEGSSLRYFYTPTTTDQRVAANTQDGLVEQDRFGRFVPSLAQSWTVSPDGLTWTFKLRQGLMYVDSSGQKTRWEITADDFVEGLRYVSDPKNGIKNFSRDVRNLIAGLNGYYLDLSDVDSGKKKDMTREDALANFSKVGISAPDKYTLVYKLSKPTPFFLSYLVMELFLPVEKEFLDSVGLDFGVSKEKLVFSGAYYISDWQRSKRIVLKANPHYWDAGKISVKTITLQYVPDPTTQVAMFQRGELSRADLGADQVKALAKSKWGQYIYSDPPSADRFSVTYWFVQNFTSSNPEFKAFVNNLNFRKALYYGIDRVKLNELDDPYKPGQIIRNTVVPEFQIFDEKGVDYTDYTGVKEIKAAGNYYNKAKARDYFKKAVAELTDGKGTIKGVSPATVDYKPIAEVKVDGKLPLQMVYVSLPDAVETKRALLLKAMLEEAFGKENIEVTLGQCIDDVFGEVVEPRRFDLLHDNFRFGYADPAAQLSRLVTNGGVNDGQYSDPEFDKLVQDAMSKTVLSERYAIFAKAEALYLDRCYVLPWAMGGTAYQITKVVPFTYPRGGFGITRFKFKGMVVEKDPITAKRYEQLKAAFYKEMAAAK